VVTPLAWLRADGSPRAIEDDSIDLRLGTDFLLARSDRCHAHIPGVTLGEEFQKAVHVPLGRAMVVPGHHTVLGATLEYIKLPYNVAAMVLTKSSWARSFITVETAPWVHPGYRGCLTLEIANVSEVPLLLYPGYRIAQLVCFAIDCGSEAKEQTRSPSYYGPTKPEPPRINPPSVALREVGINAIDPQVLRI
jgi:dCTP deaminase